MNRRIYLNQDDSAFTRCHPVEEMTVAGLERLVDYYAQGSQLAGLAFCVNMQRALFDSKVWETSIDGYDPSLGDDQPVLKRGGEVAGTLALQRGGINHFQVWLDRARFHGIEAFLSMRMNDCHGLESHGDFWSGDRKRGADQSHFQSHATEFWKANPQLRRAPYRYERSFEGAFDYAKEEVRRHHLRLVAELFERYDMDGFEMDWMRWMFMFAPGGEAKGRDILTGFVSEVDQLRKMAERQRGHAIALRHRIPAEPQSCLALGYDVPAWAEQGMADQIILSSFGAGTNFDYPIELWRRLVGKKVKILALVEAVAASHPGHFVENYHFSFAAASSALQRGADGVYLFNECYREAGGPGERRLLSLMLETLGGHECLGTLVRRHAVTYPQVHAPGEALRTQLPIPLKNDSIGSDAGRWAENITLRVAIGRKVEGARYMLCLGFSEESPVDSLGALSVRINASPVLRVAAPAYKDCMEDAFPGRVCPTVPSSAAHLLYFEADASAIQDDLNVVEFEPPQAAGRVEWAEIIVIPEQPREI